MMAARHLTLRSGDARDIAAIERLMAAAFDPRFGEAWTRGQCLGVLAMPGVRLLLASADDQPSGFALVRQVLDEAELLLIAVAPAERKRGVGASLLRAVLSEARDRGVAALHLEVRAGNPAIRLYEAQGFTRTGVRRHYYRGAGGEPFDAHSYRLVLAAADCV